MGGGQRNREPKGPSKASGKISAKQSILQPINNQLTMEHHENPCLTRFLTEYIEYTKRRQQKRLQHVLLLPLRHFDHFCCHSTRRQSMQNKRQRQKQRQRGLNLLYFVYYNSYHFRKYQNYYLTLGWESLFSRKALHSVQQEMKDRYQISISRYIR